MHDAPIDPGTGDAGPVPPRLSGPSRAESRPGWVKVARVALAIALMPVALGLAAWPMLLAGGYRPHWMDSASMEPSIPEGMLLVLIFRRGIDPEVGSVCAVRIGSREGGAPLLKVRRVVAVAGDTVALDGGRLVRNGQTVSDDEHAITPGGVDPIPSVAGKEAVEVSRHDGSKVTLEAAGGAVVIPEGYVMVLPDDRSSIQSATEPWLIRKPEVYAEVFGH